MSIEKSRWEAERWIRTAEDAEICTGYAQELLDLIKTIFKV